jgi:hypothetical protein
VTIWLVRVGDELYVRSSCGTRFVFRPHALQVVEELIK